MTADIQRLVRGKQGLSSLLDLIGRDIRFSILDCAELGTAAGERAKVRMQALAGGKTATCELTGRRNYVLMIGECDLSGRNLSFVMI